ncbi:hypothetical protein GCM10027075_36990 [Streptomyces heilongjiangensis]
MGHAVVRRGCDHGLSVLTERRGLLFGARTTLRPNHTSPTKPEGQGTFAGGGGPAGPVATTEEIE